MSDQTGHRRAARSFGSVADAYDRGRPTYPPEAASWLSESRATTAGEAPAVLELGAGTGKLTAALVALGLDVHATEPDAAMLDVLRHRLPDVPTVQSPAEEIPAPDASVDVVVCAQAFHWFDLDRALPEIARVLRPGGRLALVWNQRDDRIPWVRRLGDIIGTHDQVNDPADALASCGFFGPVEQTSYRFWQHLDRHTVQDLVLSRSNLATLDAEARAAKLAEVLAFYDEYGRGMDGMLLPYAARCFRAAVVARPEPARAEPTSAEPTGAKRPESSRGEPTSRPKVDVDWVGEDTEMLLISLR